MKLDKKGQVGLLRTAGLALVVVTIIVSVGAQVLGEIQDTQTANSLEANITGQGLDALDQLSQFFIVIAVVVAAVVIIALVSRGFTSGGF
jgi:hypothetical protein